MRTLPPIHVALLLVSACGDNLTPPPERDPYAPGDPATPTCWPDVDGRIEPAELQAALGVPANYLVSPAGTERTVDLTGAADAEGLRVWDFSTDLADDQVATLAAAPLTGRWYAASFPGGQFVAPLDAGATLEAVYAHDERALWLLGMASAEADPPAGRTLLVYEDPVPAYQFPLEVGAEWIAVGEIRDGTLLGLPYAGRDVYEVSDDALGRLELPDLSFTQAHRVRSRVTIEPAVGAPVSRRIVSFLFECFGEVARAQSRDDETEEDFATAVEVRRLGLQ